MAKITFIILAHENAGHVADLTRLLTGWDEHAHAVIHYDLKSSRAEFNKLKEEFAGSNRVHFVEDRIRCGWGDFSLIDAPVRALRLIRDKKIECDRVMLVSGACMPIRPLAELSRFLDQHPDTEFIEAFDSNWIVGGLRKERYQYWHFFNHQTHPRFFNYHYQLQRKLWPKRSFPRGLEPRFGSQWWCLTWELCEKILRYIKKHPLTYFFFSTTWIPDELFFQTMAFHFTPHQNLSARNLTFFHFNDWGKPLVFLDDHRDLLREVPFFFARKISSSAKKLKQELTEIALSPAPETPVEYDFSKRYVFPYKELLRRFPKPENRAPALFQYREEHGWPEVLNECARSFAVLYGPPQLTRRAAQALAGAPGLTVFGRLLHPDHVDFGPGVKSFKGLHREDKLIRDFDIPDYFSRILVRTENLMVFELCPGDDPDSEIALLGSENAIVLPVLPAADGGDILKNLYWALCARPSPQVDDEETTPIGIFRAMLRALEIEVPKEHRSRIDLFLAEAGRTDCQDLGRWRAALAFQHGEIVHPLVEAYPAMAEAVAATTLEDLRAGMHKPWRNMLAALSEIQAGWNLGRLNFPVAVPSVWTVEMQAQALDIAAAALQLDEDDPATAKPKARTAKPVDAARPVGSRQKAKTNAKGKPA